MTKTIIATEKAPQAIGPYAQAVAAQGQLLFVSGQIPVIPATGEIVSQDVAEQTRQSLRNLQAILAEAGGTMDSIVKTTVFIKNMDDFGQINAAYSEFFTGSYPARACVEVARLPKDVQVEIEAVAVL